MRLHLSVSQHWVALLLFTVLFVPTAGWSHPLGNFTINRYSRLAVGSTQICLHYVVDMAEIPAFQERARIDHDRDGDLSPAETADYLEETAATLPQQLRLVVDGKALPLRLQARQLEWPPGQGGLPTLRLSLDFVAALSQKATWQAEYRDANFANRLGWREIVVQAREDASLLDSSVPGRDLSAALRHYPDDFLQSPLSVDRAAFRFAPLAAGAQPAAVGDARIATAAPGATGSNPDRFAQLIALPELTPGMVALALLLAFFWGAAHALTPGHGKTLVAAYLVGSRATVRHALLLGATTTFTHTASVFVLGLITLGASHWLLPERLYPWLETASGLLVAGVGVALLRGRLRRWRAAQPAHAHAHDHHGHDHNHPHGLTHLHHDHDHDRSHGHAHDHSHPHAHVHPHAGHSHLPPATDDVPVTWRGLLALGVSGGLLPCPAALVVMLGAIALDRVGFGLALIVLFSLGLAGMLTTLGVLLVRARFLLERLSREGRLLDRFHLNRPLWQALPAVSALLILLVGISMTLTALVQTGWLRV